MILSGSAFVAVDQTFARFSSAVRQADLFADPPGPRPPKGLTGPLNVLLVAMDSEPDSVSVMHLPRGLRRGYLFSLPRDLLVDIPAFPKGFELLARRAGDCTGIERFDAGVIIDFSGTPLVFSGRGVPIHEWAAALRRLKPNNLTLIHLAGQEKLNVEAFSFFDSLLDGTVDSYVLQHPEMISGAV